MNFEFIDLSLDDRQFKGETHNKNLEDAMKQAIVNFCKSMDTGLFLLDMPTGFGKTYSVLDFMVDNYDAPEFKDKKIFFVTTLKKNLPDKELREHFARRGKADDYDKYCLRIEANADMVPGKDVVTWLRLVMDTTDKIKVHAELDIVIPHIDVNAEYTKANVMGLFKGITTKKEVVRYVFENTGIMLYAYLRGEEERREYLSGNIDINYFDYDDTHAKYSVGEIGNGMKYTIERASVVREIQAVEGSKLIFKKVLPLMGVEFVRYGMLTVVPFPFKYLREYIVKEDLCD